MLRRSSKLALLAASVISLAVSGCATTSWAPAATAVLPHSAPAQQLPPVVTPNMNAGAAPRAGSVTPASTSAQKSPVTPAASPNTSGATNGSVIRGQSPYPSDNSYGPTGQPRYGMPVSGGPPAPGAYAPPPVYSAPANGGYSSPAPYTAYQGAPPANGGFGAPPLAGQAPPPGNASAFTPNWAGQGVPGPTLPVPSEEIPDARPANMDVILNETETGRFMFGVGVNSDLGLTGQIVIDERNFDLWAVPQSWDDVINGRAFRGGGQGFRLEAMPGTEVQRYMLNFTEPYLMGTNVSYSLSAFYFTRNYFDYDEERIGGSMGLGYRLSPDLSVATRLRAERVNIFNPRVVGVPELDEVVGQNDVYSGKVTLTHDTRDMPFFPTEGHYLEIGLEQAFGTFDFPRATLDYRTYRLLYERPDGSGRHSLGLYTKLGFSGSQTPLFENFFAGGYSTLRGFTFRGASPVDSGVIVGGAFQWLNTAEYIFPLTADDMLKGVVFCDYGTVEQQVQIDWDNFRVAPGVGVRINVPAFGPAPIALDFAFPIAMAPTDQEEMFSFNIGLTR